MTYDTTRGSGTMTAPSSATWNLLKAGDLQGRNLIGANDESIGTIDELYIDYDEHTVRYCTVDVGGFLGIGAKTVLVPFERLQWSGDDLYLDADKETLENAPEFDPMVDYDADYEQSVMGAWGTPAYWTEPTYGTNHSHWREGYDDRQAGMRHDRRSV